MKLTVVEKHEHEAEWRSSSGYHTLEIGRFFASIKGSYSSGWSWYVDAITGPEINSRLTYGHLNVGNSDFAKQVVEDFITRYAEQ